MSSPPAYAPRASNAGHLWIAYLVEGCASVGSQMLMTGIYFYTHSVLKWTGLDNYLLAAGQGAVYVVGSLISSRATGRLGHRGLLLVLHLAMTVIAALLLLGIYNPAGFVALLIAYTFISSTGWPAMESLVSAGCDARALSRRVAIYNLVWSGASATAVAITGTLLAHWRLGVFILPVSMHLIALALLTLGLRNYSHEKPPPLDAGHAQPEPELLGSRKLAMWLSRVVLPAEYVVIYALMPMMPSLPIVQVLAPALQTLLASAWMAARWVTFLVLGLTTWWHTRPRLLLLAAVGLLVGFIAIPLRPSSIAQTSFALDLAAMLAAQAVLGITIGLIYAASLYFGMVLSDGSTEHGGYHEALIGVGCVLGPGSAALSQGLWPLCASAGVTAVSIVVAASLLLAAGVSIRLRRNGAG